MRGTLLLAMAGLFLLSNSRSCLGHPNNRDDIGATSQDTRPANGTIQATNLKCETLSHPLGIETLHPHLSWLLEPSRDSGRGLRQAGYRILVATSREKLAAGQGDVWDTGKVDSAKTTHIEYKGLPLGSDESYYWRVMVWDQDKRASEWSDIGEWTMGFVDAKDWKATWIAAKPDQQKDTSIGEDRTRSLPIFRHGFSLPSGFNKALVRVSGLGQYELRINERSVNDGNLAPGWTDYRKKVFYNTFDVSDLLRAGDNAIAILLGNGMYNVETTPGRYLKFSGSFGQPKLIFQLNVTFKDGSHRKIRSDRSWKQTAGPITFSSTYGGEDFDARREPRGWDGPSYNDSDWQAAVEVAGPGGQLTSELIPAVKVMRTFETMKVSNPKPGVRVYDLGQNFSGWPAIKVSGASGTTVKLIPGELLDDRGLVSQRSSGEPVWFSYVLRGSGEESWHPRFSYYGFRYVQAEETSPGGDGIPRERALIRVEGQFVHSAAVQTGEFTSSSNLINRIHSLVLAAIDSNVQSIVSDCPHREKLGWLEQTHLLGKSLMYNYDLAHLYEKIADDMHNEQLASGLVPDIAPEYVQFEEGFRDSPEWGSASILAIWAAYQQYGDQRLLAKHYEMMKGYAEYLGSKAKDGIISYGLGDWYDIGPGAPGESKLTSRGLTATAIYYQDLVVLQVVADLLGKRADAREYLGKANEVRAAFNAKLFNVSTGQYDSGSQTANAMPLAVGLTSDSERSAVLAHLVGDIRKRNNHVSAGDVGFHYVVTALLEGGRSDVLFDMISRDDPPSYGYQLKSGATTLTEAWDTNPNSSQNHFMLGHIEEWFHRGLAGLQFDLSRPTLERITIRPTVVGDVTWARDVQDTVLGRIVSEWRRKDGKLTLDVTVPVNATATVYVPTTRTGAVKENDRPVVMSTHVRKLRVSHRMVVYAVSSGQYHFESFYDQSLKPLEIQ
jgi:hypothetical protein